MDFSVIGRGTPKKDGAEKVRGRTRFLHDLALHGPHEHAGQRVQVVLPGARRPLGSPRVGGPLRAPPALALDEVLPPRDQVAAPDRVQLERAESRDQRAVVAQDLLPVVARGGGEVSQLGRPEVAIANAAISH